MTTPPTTIADRYDRIILPATSYRLLGEAEPSVRKVGKRAAGRELDGRTWDEWPEAVR